MFLFPLVGPTGLGDLGERFQGRLGGSGQQGSNERKGFLPRPLKHAAATKWTEKSASSGRGKKN